MTTDLSDESLIACEPVGRLARALGAKVVLFHACLDPAKVTTAAPAGEEIPMEVDPVILEKQVIASLQDLRSRLPKDVDVEVAMDLGEDVGGSIVGFARERDVDYIAMATHGRSGFSRMLMGSVTESVLRAAEKPMLLYPHAGESSSS